MLNFIATIWGATFQLIAGIISVFAGVVLGNWLARKNAMQLLDRQTFMNAANEFKVVFAETLDHLREAPMPSLHATIDKKAIGVIRNAFPKHNQAKIRFRIYLPHHMWIDFDKAWKEYSTAKNKTEDNTAEEKVRALFENRIKKLLKFTDPKYVFK